VTSFREFFHLKRLSSHDWKLRDALSLDGTIQCVSRDTQQFSKALNSIVIIILIL